MATGTRRRGVSGHWRVRRGTLAELTEIHQIELRVFSQNERFSRRRLRYLLRSSHGACFCCYDRTTLTGYGMALLTLLRNGRRKGRIYSIAILPEYQNMGIGTKLLYAMERFLRRSSAVYITLETKRAEKGAERFFVVQGYATAALLKGYYDTTDGVRMIKPINPHNQ